ncbi:hypothetical protein LK07_22310 [Streptomyces pluripotens]|uniref:Uncharacterized protein n=1 Tax=Streptomyces pluripotens TaxID=1355015 RepID=A0A221P8P2_9ACTN|nr:hypothetical protein LK06_021150 [Streptomyces pluripotens]ASN28611.1 hypothetical protein LK07_22310 [Streptomyces pluripotens]KIE26558.1 hypothetical protein LK08_14710 [Streptomyces sp. MUSC 125]MCH0560719.1 hypothetical protein [Streptomyces sp. MUM 16J]
MGSSSKPKPSQAEPSPAEPVTGAGFDPAFIPGITAPVATEPKGTETDPEAGTAAEPEDSVRAEGGPAEVEGPAEGPAEDSAEDPVEGSAEVPAENSAKDSAEEDAAAGEGPVFEAADRRAKIVADRKGVRLSLDAEACEFRWDEIAAVETGSPRFGKRFTITVHTPDRRWYPIEIEAAARARFKEWDEQLDAVLDAYFEDAEEDAG